MSAVRNIKYKMKYKVQILLLFICSMNLFSAPFTDNGDGTVKDVATNLVWQKCSAGLSGTSCSSGSATLFTWVNAISYCNSLSLVGKTWRLPNIKELRSILDLSKTTSPALDNSVFPNTKTGGYYWTSTTPVINSTLGWWVDFNEGYSNDSYSKVTSTYVRCVSGP